MGLDVAYWYDEVADPEKQDRVANEIKGGLELYFGLKDGDLHRARDLVAVGYSGGFMPLIEVLRQNPYNSITKTGYNTKAIVGLGAATINVHEAHRDLIVKMKEAWDFIRNGAPSEQVRLALDNLKNATTAVNFLQSTIDSIVDFVAQDIREEAYELYRSEIEKYQDAIDGFAAASLIGSTAQMIVNVYGTEDVLTELKIGGTAIGGYRDEIAGYTTAASNLINIEIVGAEHDDYMRRDFSLFEPGTWLESDRAWNVTVSDFVAELIAESDDRQDLDGFLARLVQDGLAEPINSNGVVKWVVTLQGVPV